MRVRAFKMMAIVLENTLQCPVCYVRGPVLVYTERQRQRHRERERERERGVHRVHVFMHANRECVCFVSYNAR